MKILDIRFRNLNSLRGEWHIDLQNSVYVHDGIFAITGPTGAGKTTIFDSVCLALYGRTSRQSRVNVSENEIMSRGTWECYAQVTFSTESGVFTCRWGQTRAYKSSSGALQQVKHEISDEITHKPIETRSSMIPGIVANITGMDFGRFTQAMMLEQGGFDAFLKADKNERAKILELITGMDVYSNISVNVYQRWKSEQNELANTENLISQLESRNTHETEESIRKELESKQARITELDAIHSETQRAFEWRKDIHSIEAQIKGNRAEEAMHQRELSEFESKRQELESSERAESLRADYVTLEQSRKNQSQASENVMKTNAQISDCESRISRITNEILPGLMRKREDSMRGITLAPDAIVQRICSSMDDYVKALKRKREIELEVKAADDLHKKAQEDVAASEAAKDICLLKKNNAQEKHNQALDQLMGLQARTTAAVLEEERTKLKEGQPCPLCGSLDHPGINHTHSDGENSSELFRQKESIEKESNKLKEEYDRASGDYEISKDNYTQAQLNESQAKLNLEHITGRLNDIQEECIRLRELASEAMRPLGISETDNTCSNIKLQAQRWAEEIKHLDDEIKKAEGERIKFEGQLESIRDALELANDNLEITKQELEVSEREFRLKLSDKNFPDEKTFLASRKEPHEITRLQNERERIDRKTHEIQAVYANLKDNLSEKLAMNLTEKTLEETEREYSEQEAEIKRLTGILSALTEKLRQIKSLNDSTRELEGKRASQKKILGHWELLKDLIGSANGDKFRVFAQKVTLNLVVKNANDYLKEMNGRYELILTPESDKLELSVIDKEQTGTIRPTSNLSGGERFIISLALALGLSQISGSKARVDSLFLDEGFGSLDEDSLNMALEALGEVKRKGRMIGIISHVQALKERISAQISVIRKTEGRSIIEGPGCSGK